MTASRFVRAATAGSLVVLMAAAPALAAPKLRAPKLPGGAGGGYSVNGKKGPFLKQIADRKLDQTGGAGSLGLADDAMNQGELQAARLRMPETERKVAEMLARIEAQWPYAKTQPLKVQILGLPHYSAQSLPDGSVVVAFGLLDKAESDDEVAFVLAHELGHIRLNHFAKAAKLQRQRQLASKLGQLYVTASAIKAGVEAKSLDFNNRAADRAARQAAATTDLVRFATEVMIAPAWSRGQEDEADALGFDLSEGAPYAAETASARVFDTIQADEDNRQAMVATMQAQAETQLKAAATEGNVSRLMSGNMSGDDMKRGLLKGAGRLALNIAANAQGGPKHRTPEARKKGMADYTTEAYPDGLPLRDESSTWLKSIRASKEFQQAKIAVAAVQASMRARAAADYPKATAEIIRAQATTFRAAPMIVNEAARLADDQGQTDKAELLFVSAHKSPDQTVDGYVDHVKMLYRVARYDRARQVIAQAIPRFRNDDKPFLSLQVAMAYKQGRNAEGQQMLRRCADYGDDGLKQDCMFAAESAGGGADAAAVQSQKPGLPDLGKVTNVLGNLPFKRN